MPEARRKLHRYNESSPTARALDVLGDKWTLLIIRILIGGPVRYVEIQRRLPGISAEQLRTRLNQMMAAGLLTRARYREVPPRVEYTLTESGRDAIPVLRELSRWGRTWAGQPHQEGESISIESLLLDMIAVDSVHDLSIPEVTLVVNGDDETRMYRVSVSRGEVSFYNADDDTCSRDHVVSGTNKQWLNLFEHGETEGMTICGQNARDLIIIFFAINTLPLAA